jgi:DNA-binding response OmpR family regulator
VDDTGALIAIIEDERPIADAVATRLRAEGFRVEIAGDGPSGVELVGRVRPDLVVLDLMLPGFDGFEVCRRIQLDRHVPVIMLTARDTEADLVTGLGVGADDYVTKPFSPRALVARIHAVLRRTQPATGVPDVLRHGGIELDLTGRSAVRDGCAVHLTVTEFDLAAWFLRHPGVVFTREQLLQSVWGYPDGSGERTVDSHIQAVRRKLGAAFVRTVHGVGYGLGAP